jgi:peptidoglycan hydrolase-like protein with peptidoglycan-binding domain
MNRIVNSKTLLICVIGFLSLHIAPALASEVTGSLCTGVNCPVEGTVIAAPTVSPAAGSFTSNQSVTLTSTGATSIRYTTDGTVPTCASTQYSSAISVTSSKTIKAISCYANNASSTVASFAYTISVPSSGGGGGGGSFTVVASPTPTPTPTPTVTTPTTETIQANTNSVISAQDQLKVLMARLQALQNQAGAQGSINSTIRSGLSFSRNLQVNSQGEDVRQLQVFLNNNGFPVAATGAGSSGRETNFFGNATRAALAKYQTSVGVSATGYLGPLTRAKIAENIAPTASVTTPTPVATVPSIAFSRPLSTGSEGTDVTSLQNVLKNQGLFNVSATGYFGPLTESAVKAFQEKYNIAKSGDSGYGFVGPKTRAKLNGFIQ